jgi:peptidoglycan/xylan/chitin deacetylase (PgdA/CDA1 family)
MLTLDDGPSPAWTPKMLALLAKHGVRATFCMIGKQVRAEPRLARAVAEHGHVVANHTWTHDEMLTKRPVARIRRELRDTSAVIADACGYEPRQFRAPGGNWGRALLDEVQREQMLPLGWSVDPTDWARPGTRSIERTFRSVRRHDIVLCHDGGGDRSQTYAALEYALPRWKDAGYTFVTLPSPRSRFAE